MATLLEDIKKQSDWLVKAFNSDGLKLDYTIDSFIQIDKFFEIHSKNGNPKSGGRLSQNLGSIIFSIGSYIGETIIRNVNGSVWKTDDNDPQGEITASVTLPDGTTIFPMQRAMKRLKNGFEDSVYPYGYELTKNYLNADFDQSFWEMNSKKNIEEKKSWWKFW